MLCERHSFKTQGAPLKLKVTTRSKSSSAMAEVTNLSLIRARNGASLFSRHFVGFVEYVDNYNNRSVSMKILVTSLIDASPATGTRPNFY